MSLIAISAGHGLKIRGAAGPSPWGLDEVNEARRVCTSVVDKLKANGLNVVGPFFDDVSTTQSANLNAICAWHNRQPLPRIDVSVHFNAYQTTTSTPRGTEVLWVTQQELARQLSSAIATAGAFINRGPKKRTDLKFLNSTTGKSVLIETCFCDSKPDCDLYRRNFDAITAAIAQTFGAGDVPQPPLPPTPDVLANVTGKCSWFGGPNDTGVAPNEGLAFLYQVSDAPDLFLPTQPPGTTGLARRLNPDKYYVAIRWDYNVTPKEMLRDQSKKARVTSGGNWFEARPADWGPNENTGRVADLSPGLMDALEIKTDATVEVIYPAPVVTPPVPEPEPEPTDDAVVNITTTGPVTLIVNGQTINAGT